MIVEKFNEKNNSNDENRKFIVEEDHKLQANSNNVSDIVYASRFKRWLASLINVLLFYVAILFGSIVLNEIAGLIFIFLYIGYQLFLMYNAKQTLAKKWLNLQVIDYRTNHPLTFGRYVLREFIEQLFALTGILTSVSAIVAFANEERRSLVDIVMSTIVVKKT